MSKYLLELEESMDQILANHSLGSLAKMIGNNLRGINARHKHSPMPLVKDSHGFTFFTRPVMNLTDGNVSNTRKLFSLLNSSEDSYQRYFRMMLDPRLSADGFKSSFVDNAMAFIPILGNSITSISGWPQIAPATYTSESGLYNQQHSFTDGALNIYEVFELSCSFRNTKGHPIIYMMLIWVYYQALVFEGIVWAYPDKIAGREIDYNTRIYRMTMDASNKYISSIAATGASYPLNVPIDSLLDFSVEKPYLDSNNEVNVRFKSHGFIFNEEYLKLEFNQTQALFSEEIRMLIKRDHDGSVPYSQVAREDERFWYHFPEAGITKINHSMLEVTEGSYNNNFYYNLNYKMFPYINLITNELEWWTYTGLIPGLTDQHGPEQGNSKKNKRNT